MLRNDGELLTLKLGGTGEDEGVCLGLEPYSFRCSLMDS